MEASADPGVVDAYHKRLHPGPGQETALISWTHPISAPWNQHVIHMLVKRFMDGVERLEYRGLTRIPDTISSEWIQRDVSNMLQRQSRLRSATIQSGRLNETGSERKYRIENAAQVKLEKARRSQRKQNVRHPGVLVIVLTFLFLELLSQTRYHSREAGWL